ncbi:MAG: hypothetical protein ACI9T7_001707 [Oleiphilaceae bacterium]
MEKHIEPRVLLLAAEKIRQHGEKQEDFYVLDHVQLEMSYDGYTITLKDQKVAITVFFHNKIKSDYRNMSDLEVFYQRVMRISELN